MMAQRKNNLPQEGTTHCGESLTEPSSVCPSNSGGDNVCSNPGSSLDLSGLAEAIQITATTSPVDTTTMSQWNVAAHKRPCKRGNTKLATVPNKMKSQLKRSRPNRRARREALQSKIKAPTVTSDAAAETQREPLPSTTKEAVKAKITTESPHSKQKGRQTPRGSRGRRTAATAPTPEKEQPGTGNGSDERASVKRARLDETQSPRGEAKRAKTDAKPKRTVRYADASQSHLRVAVITVPPKDLSQGQADQLRETIDDSILQAVLSPPSPSAQAPSFRGRPFLMDGVLAMWCEDANALSWLEETVKTMTSPIPGTTMTVIRQSELKKRLKAGLLIHTRITEAATLHRVLCAQNPWYKVDSWQCYDMTVDEKQQEGGSKDKVVHLILGIPEDQKQAILDRDRRVAHMSGSGYLRFFTTEEATTAGGKPAATSESRAKESSTQEPSTSAPQQGPSEVETNAPPEIGGGTSDEDNALRSP